MQKLLIGFICGGSIGLAIASSEFWMLGAASVIVLYNIFNED
jgi:hypothetical protein